MIQRFPSVSFLARRLAKTESELASDRAAWGKKLARFVKKHGWKALEKMPVLQLRHAIDGRDGILVQHHKWRELNQAVIRSGNKLSAADRRWTTQWRDHVRVRTCKGKRT